MSRLQAHTQAGLHNFVYCDSAASPYSMLPQRLLGTTQPPHTAAREHSTMVINQGVKEKVQTASMNKQTSNKAAEQPPPSSRCHEAERAALRTQHLVSQEHLKAAGSSSAVAVMRAVRSLIQNHRHFTATKSTPLHC